MYWKMCDLKNHAFKEPRYTLLIETLKIRDAEKMIFCKFTQSVSDVCHETEDWILAYSKFVSKSENE